MITQYYTSFGRGVEQKDFPFVPRSDFFNFLLLNNATM